MDTKKDTGEDRVKEREKVGKSEKQGKLLAVLPQKTKKRNLHKYTSKKEVYNQLSQRKIIDVVFGASLAAPKTKDKNQMTEFRKENDKNLFPRDEDGNMIPSLVKYWDFRNCSETNPWTCLSKWRPDLPTNSYSISVNTKEEKPPCLNCQRCQD